MALQRPMPDRAYVSLIPAILSKSLRVLIRFRRAVMGWIDAELVLVALAAMLSPTTLSFSVLSLVLSDRPRRSGFWFYVGAFGATLAIGIVAGFVLGDRAATDHPDQPTTWVAIIDIVAAVLLAGWIVRVLRRPPDPARAEAMITRMTRVTGSPAIVIVG